MISRPVPCSLHRRALLLAATIYGAIACAPMAHAARMTISGENLDLTIPCTGEVRVKVDPNMKDGATLDSSSLTQVAMHASRGDSESRISLSTKACSPNGRLAISVSANTGVTIHDSHDTHFVITGTLASLDASLDSTTLDIDDTQSLDLRMQGASTVHIKSLERAAQVVASGTSSLTADTVQLAALSAQLTQDATMMLSGGTIDALTLVTADRAGATILGQATVATVAANGSGVVNIQAVTGPMVRSGTGSVRVGAPNGVIYRPTPPPPGTAAAAGPAETSAAPSAVAVPQVPAVPTPFTPTPAPTPSVSGTSDAATSVGAQAPSVPSTSPTDIAPSAPRSSAIKAPVVQPAPEATQNQNQNASPTAMQPTTPSAAPTESPATPTASTSGVGLTPSAAVPSSAEPASPTQAHPSGENSPVASTQTKTLPQGTSAEPTGPEAPSQRATTSKPSTTTTSPSNSGVTQGE